MHRLPSIYRRCRQGCIALVLLAMAATAHAQVDKLNRNITYLRDGIIGVCVVLFTVLFTWAGIEIAAKHKRPQDVWPIVLGASLVAAAGTLAAVLVN